MKVIFASNYLNHHQLSFSIEMIKETEGQFIFIATEEISEERVALGYTDMNSKYPWVIKAYQSKEEKERAIEQINQADVVIMGSAPEYLIEQRLRQNKLVFRYSERIFKNKGNAIKNFLRRIKYCFFNKNIKRCYMLCASAYAAMDYSKLSLYVGKTYKWGYFPELKHYNDINSLIENKKNNSILWVGRFIEWKHPEVGLEVARRLKEDGYCFNLSFIGCGELEETLKKKVKEENLENFITFLGSMSTEQVRAYMEESEIFLFTSDRNEGWGAVLNEAMNSACAVVASHSIGSVPFLIQDYENGLIFKDGQADDLYKKVKFLLDNPTLRKKISMNAYETIYKQWNASNAAKRLILLSKEILSGNKKAEPFKDSVCSKAEKLRDNWYKQKS